jgi:hypothetical protein
VDHNFYLFRKKKQSLREGGLTSSCNLLVNWTRLFAKIVILRGKSSWDRASDFSLEIK